MRLRGHLSRALANTGSFADLSENPVARNTKKVRALQRAEGLAADCPTWDCGGGTLSDFISTGSSMMHEVSSNRPLARRRRLEQALGLLPKAMPHHQCRCCFCVCRCRTISADVVSAFADDWYG